MKISCNLIGSGKLGISLISALLKTQYIELAAIYNRNFSHSQGVALQLGVGRAVVSITDLPPADLTLICSPDDSLAAIGRALASLPGLKRDSLVIHCSGVHTAEVFGFPATLPVKKASCHPLKSFAFPDFSGQALEKTACILEGDEEALVWLEEQMPRIGATCHRIKSAQKTTYHLAACMASNYLVTLAQAATDLFNQIGIDPGQSQQLIVQLMQGTLNNLTRIAPPSRALTGPIQRGDVNTILSHLNQGQAGEWEGIYRALGLATLGITSLEPPVRAALFELLGQVISPQQEG